ncbi:hypothetical protein DPX16_22465 [Anabarilius grahami]|uniref:Uncharacterized protein n=1 Tax=Anabarilius grahami TaxID=495550 RepID=A0A3N0YYL2_ANAGA|nr:hypothetical protein DPX16_22465 [Anabarilius grahami]
MVSAHWSTCPVRNERMKEILVLYLGKQCSCISRVSEHWSRKPLQFSAEPEYGSGLTMGLATNWRRKGDRCTDRCSGGSRCCDNSANRIDNRPVGVMMLWSGLLSGNTRLRLQEIAKAVSQGNYWRFTWRSLEYHKGTLQVSRVDVFRDVVKVKVGTSGDVIQLMAA